MRHGRRRRALAMLALGAMLVQCLAGPEPALAGEGLEVLDVRHWSYAGYTRVVVELSGSVDTDAKLLGADGERPDRLYLDLPGVRVGEAWSEPVPVTDGLLQRIRLGQNAADRARVVIDLDRYERHRLFTLSGPDRVVLDVYASVAQDAPPTAERTTDADAARGPREEAAEDGASPARDSGRAALDGARPGVAPVPLRGVHTVVIDPGHGGEDPGAIGQRGLREKDLTLAVGLDLRDRLRDRGFRVVMTRQTDRTVDLEERTAFAEGAGADVFVSIHANAARGSKAHGLETYYLDESHERHTLRVAARESGVDPRHLDPLQRAMAGLRVGEVSAHSAKLAESVHAEMVDGVRQVYGSVRDLGVKKGPFHVLFLSGAPAILVEMGFLTHRTEAKRLDSGLYRAVVAERIARGLSGYRSARMQLAARNTP